MKELSKSLAVQQWPYYGEKPGRSSHSTSLKPLTKIHLESVEGMAGGPNLRAPVWPSGFSATDARSVELCCDRVFPVPLSRGDSVSYLSRMRERIAQEIDEISVDCVLFPATPHVPWDLLVAMEFASRGVPVLVIRGTQLTNRVIVSQFPFDFRAGRFQPRPTLVDSLSTATDSLDRDSPRLASAKALNRQASLSSVRFLVFEPLRLLRSVAHSLESVFFGRVDGGKKISRFPSSSREEHYWNFMRGSTFVLLRLRSIAHMFQRSRELSRLSSFPEGNYVYFSLHYQPEQNTDPEASDFRFQVAAVTELRRLLDEEGLEDLVIAVKDHPRQFSGGGDVRSGNFRPRGFYESLSKIPRTLVIGTDVGSKELIEGSSLTVTANGSASWEALRLGKPALTFVSTWHSDCLAAPSLARLRESGRSLNDLIGMSCDEVRSSLDDFLTSEDISIPGAFKGPHADLVTNPQLAEEMARCLAAMIGRVAETL